MRRMDRKVLEIVGHAGCLEIHEKTVQKRSKRELAGSISGDVTIRLWTIWIVVIVTV